MPVEMTNLEDAFELQLVHQDLLGDAIFLVGTLISINQNKKAEQEIINPEENQASMISTTSVDNEPLGIGIIPLVLFLAGTSIFAYTSTVRLNKQKAEAGNDADQTTANNIKGGEIIILGQFIRIIGYVISIIGNRIKIANPE